MKIFPLALALSLSTLAATAVAQEKSGDSPNKNLQRVTIIPHVGLLVSGSGTATSKCVPTGGYTGCGREESASYDDKSSPSFGFDLLFPVAPTVRLGFGTLYVPKTKAKVDDSSLDLGSDVSGVGILEFVLPSSAGMAFALRAQGGALVYIPGGDATDALDREQSRCTADRTITSCNVERGPFLGYTFGGGVGFIGGTGPVRPRVDFMVQYFSVKQASSKRDRNGVGREAVDEVAGTRFWIRAGVEF
jgi:hypothetical protein